LSLSRDLWGKARATLIMLVIMLARMRGKRKMSQALQRFLR